MIDHAQSPKVATAVDHWGSLEAPFPELLAHRLPNQNFWSASELSSLGHLSRTVPQRQAAAHTLEEGGYSSAS